MSNTAIVAVLAAFLLGIVAFWRLRSINKPVPAPLREGRPLPDFRATDESGNPVRSTELHGTAAVLLFVRGSWCPFCSSQVENLTEHYRDIIDLGARLILVTPKPLQTTRRVAKFFEVEFEFWLDESLAVTRQLGLLQEAGVPSDNRNEYGADTIWPTALVVDRNGIIRYSDLSRSIADRPDPARLVKELKAAIAS